MLQKVMLKKIAEQKAAEARKNAEAAQLAIQ
jgi:hypothetical protein